MHERMHVLYIYIHDVEFKLRLHNIDNDLKCLTCLEIIGPIYMHQNFKEILICLYYNFLIYDKVLPDFANDETGWWTALFCNHCGIAHSHFVRS